MRDLTIPDWGDIFSGQGLSATHYRGYRGNPEDIKEWMRYLAQSPTAHVVLAATEDSKEFFAVDEDFSLLIPKHKQEECFYSLKNGFTAPNCPAQFIYFARQIFKRYGIANLIGPALPKDLKSKVMKQDYFGAGYTAVDAICNFVWKEFKPITKWHSVVKCGDWYEVYIPNTELVAAVPIEIGRSISQSEISAIELKHDVGLVLHGTPLCRMAGSVKLSSNYYDLRRSI